MFGYLCLLVVAIGAIQGYKISKEKCFKYNKSVEKCENKPLPLIVGGTEVDDHEFPHMALIGFGDEPVQYECGGSLISENFVLSAAHCTFSKENGPASRVKFGTLSRSSADAKIQERKIVEIISHPNYKSSFKQNDIALFKLEKPIEITAEVKPACLNFNKNDLTQLVPVATGFGKTSFTDENGSEKLLKVSLPMIKNDECAPFFKKVEGGIVDTMICAGTLKGGKDTCQGDSGGPLQTFMDAPYCSYSIIGITSFGRFCGYAKSPAIYTNVYAFVPWIEKHVWGSNEI